MNKLQKQTIAYELRAQGNTFKQIGDYFEISYESARQLVKSYKSREKEIENASPFMSEILCSECDYGIVMNCLRKHGINLDAESIIAVGAQELRKKKNMGMKTMVKIARSLERIGKIKNAYEWLHGKPRKPRRGHGTPRPGKDFSKDI